jgi:sugar-specific transcriptional regulator TrmB
MTSDSTEQARSVAVDQLKRLGLSTYAARTFVALTSLNAGTAQEVSDVADVPRTRVYDAVEELRERGLVDVQQSTPKRFWAISAETAGRHFEEEYTQRVRSLRDALETLSSETQPTEQRGVWTVSGSEAIADRIVELVGAAEEEVVYMTVEGLLTDEIAESLRRASDRGVSIRLAEMANSTERRLDEVVPDARVFESLWDWSDTPAGRLVMVDRDKTLVGVFVSGDQATPHRSREETAIWGSGEANGLVVVLKTMFTWELEDTRD